MADDMLGEVSVDVYADLSRLEKDFSSARRKADQFDKVVNDKTGRAAKKAQQSMADLDRATEDLARSYSPLHAAQIRLAKDLEKVDRLQRANILTQKEAAMFTRKANAAYLDAARSQSQLATYSAKAGGQLKALGVIAAGAAIAGIIQLGKESLDSARRIDETSRKLGLTAEELQKYEYAAKKTGVSNATLEQGFEKLGDSISKAAAGADRESKLFKLLGISLKDSAGNARTSAQIFPELADALLRVKDANERAALAQVVFGEGASDLEPLLAGGSKGINTLADAAERLGIVLSNEQIQRSSETAKKLEDVKEVLSANIASVVADNAGAIITLANALGALAGAAIRAFAAMVKFGNLGPMSVGFGVSAALFGGAPTGQPAAKGTGPRKGDFAAMYDKLHPKGDIDASGFLAPKPPKGRKGRSGPSAETLAKRAEAERLKQLRNDKAFADELSGFQRDILQMASQQATNADTRATIDNALLDIERDKFKAMLALEGPGGSKKYSEAEAEQLRLKFAEVDRLKREEVRQRTEDQNQSEALDLAIAERSNQEEMLQTASQLARTSKDRRDAELGLLELQHRIEKLQIEKILTDSKSTDTEIEIAEARRQFLDQIKEFQKRIILLDTQGPVARFFDSLPRTAAEIDEAVERIRATNLESLRARSVQFADDVGAAFGDMARSIVNLESPLKILQSLLTDLAHIFTEEVLIRPIQEKARALIGAPLAERVTGAPAGAEGLWQKQISTNAFLAASQLDRLRLAASGAAGALGNTQTFGIDPLGQASANSAAALEAQTGEVSNFGNALQQIIASLSGGGGGSSGIFSAILGIAASAIAGPTAAGVARLTPSVNATIAANPGIFHDGGEIGPGGMPVRRKLRPGEVNITARVGERVIPRGPSRQFGSILETISSGRMPALRGGAGGPGSISDRSMHVQFGDIILPGVTDERTGRRTGKQMAAKVHEQITRAARSGVTGND